MEWYMLCGGQLGYYIHEWNSYNARYRTHKVYEWLPFLYTFFHINLLQMYFCAVPSIQCKSYNIK
jgi:hypothetical protein